MMMQKENLIILTVLILISIVNGNYNSQQYSNCKQYENKIYQLNITFPGNEPFSTAIRLFPNGLFDEIFSIGNGHNEKEIGLNIVLSNRIGYYKCLPKNIMRLTGFGYLYQTNEVEALKKNGAVVAHDYYFRFSSSGKTLTGQVLFSAYDVGVNPFKTNDDPILKGDIGNVDGELLRFHPLDKNVLKDF